MSLVLTSAELADYTGKVRPSAQARVLKAMFINFKVRPDGSIAVLREDLLNPGERSKVRSREPNWSALTPERV